MYRIAWTRKAQKQLLTIARAHRKSIVDAVEGLAQWPGCQNVRNLVNRDGYRLRVGRYRVLFTVHEGECHIIQVEEVKKRDERTY